MPYSVIKCLISGDRTLIHVSPRFLKNLEDDKELELQSNTQYRQFVQQQVRTINRYDIVHEALLNMGTVRTIWQKEEEPERRAVERLQGALQITPVPDTYLITIGLESKESSRLDRIVNAVVESYLKKVKETEIYASDVRVANLQEERLKLLAEIQTMSGQRMEFVQRLGVTIFNPHNPSPYDKLLTGSREALAAARRRRIEAEAQLTRITASIQMGNMRLRRPCMTCCSKTPA